MGSLNIYFISRVLFGTFYLKPFIQFWNILLSDSVWRIILKQLFSTILYTVVIERLLFDSECFVVRRLVEQAEAGPIVPGTVGSFRSWWCVILGDKDVWLVQLQCSSLTSWCLKFRNRTFLTSWRGFLQGFVLLPWFNFQALHHMKPQRERSDGVDSGRLGGISPSIHAHGKEELLPVFDE